MDCDILRSLRLEQEEHHQGIRPGSYDVQKTSEQNLQPETGASNPEVADALHDGSADNDHNLESDIRVIILECSL